MILGACTGDDAPPEPIPLPTAVFAPRPPPPISGGTLLVAQDNTTIVVSDPDRDRIVLADLASKTVLEDIKLEALDEPGRIVEGPPTRVHVALRRSGHVVTIDLPSKKIIRRMKVCPAPRGMAYDDGMLHVACAGGELVTLLEESGAVLRSLELPSDLRDVVVQGTNLRVTRFRSAELLTIDANGALIGTAPLPSTGIYSSGVAWRMVQHPNGAAIVYQRFRHGYLRDEPGDYLRSPGCGQGVVTGTVYILDTTSNDKYDPYTSAAIEQGALPVDLAFSGDGATLAVVAAGSNAVLTMDVASYRSHPPFEWNGCNPVFATPIDQGEPIAVAFAGSVRVVQTREPARLVLDDGIIELGGVSMLDTGHYLFHHAPNPLLNSSCASCHPEGRDDGHVWSFAWSFGAGIRRTPSLAGGVLATTPLNWDGGFDGFDSLVKDVFTGRMVGQPLDTTHWLALATWVDSVPHLPVSPAKDVDAVNRGKTLFEAEAIGCANCHSGPRLTNNQTENVGTQGLFQVPSLRGVASRAPYMHDGCARTLKDRFTDEVCGGGDKHGVTSNLTPAEIDDLVAYLETL